MDIDNLTLGQIKQLQSLLGGAPCDDTGPWKTGQAYHIRTVTHHYTGRLTSVSRQELTIENAAWIADSGRFMQGMADGELNEIEPYPAGSVIIGRGSIVDACEWTHDLPEEQK